MFVKNAWYIAAMADEVGRTLKQRWILDEPVVMYRTADGKPVALYDVCPHRSMPLSKGELLGDQLRCGYHGLVFAPDGRCTHIPAQTHIAPSWCVKSYRLVEKWRWLWIWMGDPKSADESLIPDFHWNEDPDWIPTGGHFEIGCHYQLLVDNLLDLSHLAFVHRTTIGTDAVAENPATVSREGNAVRIVRSMPSCPAPPLYAKLIGYSGEIDRSQDIVFTPPSQVVITSRSVPKGSNEADKILEYRVLNGITPGTKSTCHHFWAVSRNCVPDPQVTKLFHEGSVRAFSEDVTVLETQQTMLDRMAGRIAWMHYNADGGGNAARVIVDKLLKREAAGATERAAMS